MIKEFDGIELPGEWNELLEIGDTYFYSDGKCILNYHMYDGVCLINSISLENAEFPRKMLKNIIKIAKAHKNVIITSTVLNIKNYMFKHGFTYNEEINAYEKGLSWV